MIAVLVVDDMQLVRRLIGIALSTSAEFEVVGEAGDGATAVSLYQELQPDVVTLDLELTGEPGLVVLRRLLQLDPDARVVILSSHDDRATVDATLAVGARAYLTKPVDFAALRRAVTDAAAAPRDYRPAGSATPEAPAVDDSAPAVLVVEDAAPTCALLVAAVLQAGCRLAGAASRLGEAGRLLGERPSDLLLLDLTLEDGDALEWLAAAKAAVSLPPVVIITAHADRGRVIAAARLGVAGYLVKPVSVADVVATVRRVLFPPPAEV
jgi:DNA-binding NarL/FixJ family response regulator